MPSNSLIQVRRPGLALEHASSIGCIYARRERGAAWFRRPGGEL